MFKNLRQIFRVNTTPELNGNMSPPRDKARVIANLWRQIDAGKPIVGAGAGIGLSAKFLEAGGADLIIIYNSGRFRMAGRGSLAGLMPYGNANDVVLEMVISFYTHRGDSRFAS